MKYDLSKIMKRAWEIKREDSKNIFGICLEMAWEEAKKAASKKVAVIKDWFLNKKFGSEASHFSNSIEIEKEIVPEPFFEIKHYSRNYKGQNINRIARIIYFVIKTNKTYDKQKTNLTENEKANNFEIRSIPFDDFEKELTLVKETNPLEINRVIAEEILESFFVLKKTL